VKIKYEYNTKDRFTKYEIKLYRQWIEPGFVFGVNCSSFIPIPDPLRRFSTGQKLQPEWPTEAAKSTGTQTARIRLKQIKKSGIDILLFEYSWVIPDHFTVDQVKTVIIKKMYYIKVYYQATILHTGMCKLYECLSIFFSIFWILTDNGCMKFEYLFFHFEEKKLLEQIKITGTIKYQITNFFRRSSVPDDSKSRLKLAMYWDTDEMSPPI